MKSALAGHTVLGLENTCLDPGLYRLESTGAQIRLPDNALKLNEMVPAVLNQEAETTLLDVPDALIALEKWPGEVKVIGPISEDQLMAVAFRKTSPELRQTFNGFLKHLRADGTYERLVRRYYPAVFRYYGDFFADSAGG